MKRTNAPLRRRTAASGGGGTRKEKDGKENVYSEGPMLTRLPMVEGMGPVR